MKTLTYIMAALGAAAVSLAQEDPGPSPTESVGCVPHNDHWDCEGPRETSPSAPAATTPAVTEEHEEGHEEGTGVLPPSPTESFGCVAHGDHWDCEGPVETADSAVTTPAPAPVTTEEDEEHEAEETGVLPPSPTESFGCVAHGDHWDCEGPVAATSAIESAVESAVESPSTTVEETPSTIITESATLNATDAAESPEVFTGGAPMVNVGAAGSFGAFALAALAGFGLAF